mmetsp:Transcript_22597/g.53346  ORF Transcript_22597/g.53346 Transcript_22597/m.53346 type:complete len:221 (-) Transcript_22597:26-688(-)
MTSVLHAAIVSRLLFPLIPTSRRRLFPRDYDEVDDLARAHPDHERDEDPNAVRHRDQHEDVVKQRVGRGGGAGGQVRRGAAVPPGALPLREGPQERSPQDRQDGRGRGRPEARTDQLRRRGDEPTPEEVVETRSAEEVAVHGPHVGHGTAGGHRHGHRTAGRRRGRVHGSHSHRPRRRGGRHAPRGRHGRRGVHAGGRRPRVHGHIGHTHNRHTNQSMLK